MKAPEGSRDVNAYIRINDGVLAFYRHHDKILANFKKVGETAPLVEFSLDDIACFIDALRALVAPPKAAES